jgi:carboxymethylenebutenolidase
MATEELALGHLARPDSGVHPGVVMIHDVWGLSDHTRDLAGRLAREGFAVLAVNLYHRRREVRIEDPGPWMRALSDLDALADVQAAADLLAGHPASAGRKVGVTGFCMGGSFALLAACSVRALSAAVPFYGLLSYRHGLLAAGDGPDRAVKPREPLDAVRDLRCPLLAIFGEDDEFVPLSDVRELERRLAASAQPHEVAVYPGCGHAFLNDTRPAAFRPEQARHAWARMVEFFRKRLA